MVGDGEVEGFIAKPAARQAQAPAPAPAQTLTTDTPRDVKLIQTFGPGQAFGEVSLLHGSARGATIRAKSDVVSACPAHRQPRRLDDVRMGLPPLVSFHGIR